MHIFLSFVFCFEKQQKNKDFNDVLLKYYFYWTAS